MSYLSSFCPARLGMGDTTAARPRPRAVGLRLRGSRLMVNRKSSRVHPDANSISRENLGTLPPAAAPPVAHFRPEQMIGRAKTHTRTLPTGADGGQRAG